MTKSAVSAGRPDRVPPFPVANESVRPPVGGGCKWATPHTTDPFKADRAVPDAGWNLVARAPVERSDPDALTVAIISAVADAEGVSLEDVRHPPLYEVCDTAVLDAAFFEGADGRSGADATAEFTYRGHRVVVHSTGWVLVYDRE